MSLAIQLLTQGAGGYVGGGGGTSVPPDPTGGVVAFENGMNIGPIHYYDPMPVFVDLVKSGIGFFDPGTINHVAIDSSGWPNGDFTFGLQQLPPDSPLGQTVTILVDGNPGTVTWHDSKLWTKAEPVYDPVTDTATIRLTSPSTYSENLLGCQINFTNTKKTPSSAVGSGVRRIRIPRPGYESRPNQIIADEFKNIFRFDTIRMMKGMGTEVNNTIVSWADYPKRNQYWGRSFGGDFEFQGTIIGGPTTMPIEDIVDLANELQLNLWVCINHSADGDLGTLSVDYGMAQYIEANLRSDLVCYYETGNELWNTGYPGLRFGNDRGHAEVHGFWSDEYQRASVRAVAIQRTSNVATITLNYDHGMSGDQARYKAWWQGRTDDWEVVAHPTGLRTFTIPDNGTNCKFDCQLNGSFDSSCAVRTSGVVTVTGVYNHGFTTGNSVYVPLDGLTSTTKIFTITVTGATSYTFADAGSNGALSTTSNNLCYGGSLSTGSPLTFDGDLSGSLYFANKYWIRRACQMSDLIKSAVGDAKFMTRHRPVWMSQWAGGSLYWFADWGKSMLTAIGTTYKAKFYAMGGGGYPQGTMNNGTRPVNNPSQPYTKAQFLIEYEESTTTAHSNDDGGVAFFEPDLKAWYAMSEGIKCMAYEIGVDTKIYNDGPYKSQNALELRHAVSDPQWKHIESNFPLQLAQNGLRGAMFFNGEMQPLALALGQGYWAIANGLFTSSPKQQFHNEWQASPPLMSKNLVPGALDLRISLGYFYGVPPDWPYNTMSNPPGQYPLSGDRWRYICNSNETRTMSVTLAYKKLQTSGHTVTLQHNDAVIGTFTIASGSVGSTLTSNALSVPMDYGPNALALVRDSGNSDFELHTLDFV